LLTVLKFVFFSGEKPSLKDWRSFVEIKGRVKLSAFQEFVEQLPKSRSRAIMVILFLAVVCLYILFVTGLKFW
jgi:hypothetical protein